MLRLSHKTQNRNNMMSKLKRIKYYKISKAKMKILTLNKEVNTFHLS